MPPVDSEARPSRDAELKPDPFSNRKFGDNESIRLVVGDNRTVPFSIPDTGLIELNSKGFIPSPVVNSGLPSVNPLSSAAKSGFTIGVVGNVTLKPGGSTVFNPGGNKEVIIPVGTTEDPGFMEKFRAACSSAMNCIVGDKVVFVVNGVVPVRTVKFDPEVCILTVPGGRIGLGSAKLCFIKSSGPMIFPPNPPVVGADTPVAMEVRMGATRIGAIMVVRGTTGINPGLPIPIRIIGGRPMAGMVSIRNKDTRAKTSNRLKIVRMAPLSRRTRVLALLLVKLLPGGFSTDVGTLTQEQI
jgi:hypothetical protein